MNTRTAFHTFSLALTLIALLLVSVTVKGAEKADPALQKMREALRNTMIQLRDANAKLAVAQAAQTDDEEKIKELQGQLEELTKKIRYRET